MCLLAVFFLCACLNDMFHDNFHSWSNVSQTHVTSCSNRSPPPLWACPNSSTSPSELIHPATPPSVVHPETIRNNLRPVETLRPQTGWLPSATSNQQDVYYWAAPGHHLSNNSTRSGFAMDSNFALSATNRSENISNTAFSNGGSFSALDGCYSLFSDQGHLPFGPGDLFALGTLSNTTEFSTPSSSNLLLSGETAAGHDSSVCKREDNEEDSTTTGHVQQRVEFDEWPNL